MGDQAIEQEIQAKGLTAPRVKPEDLTANIADTEFVTHISKGGQVLRWAILTTQSGYAAVGRPSVSVSPENDDEKIGRQVAYDNSRNELWPLMGYALKQQLHDAACESALLHGEVSQQPAVDAAWPPHLRRVFNEKNEVDERILKLRSFFGSPTFAGLDAPGQQLMRDQAAAMQDYSDILAKRLSAFVAA